MKATSSGFAFLPLIISVIVIAILAAIIIPTYQQNTRKKYYSDIPNITVAYRAAIGTCVQNLGTVMGCTAGSNGVPPPITHAIGAVAAVSVVDGVITVIPVPAHGVTATDTYVLTPTLDTASGSITWTASGDSVVHHYIQ